VSNCQHEWAGGIAIRRTSDGHLECGYCRETFVPASKLSAADEAWHEQEDELQALRGKLDLAKKEIEEAGKHALQRHRAYSDLSQLCSLKMGEVESLQSRLQACFELVERPGLTSDGVVWELCKMRDASIQPNVVEKPAPIEDEASKFYAERAEEYFRIYGEAGKAALRKWFEGELPPEDRAFCLVHQLRFGEDDRCPKCALSE
jgi:hypothetical protein